MFERDVKRFVCWIVLAAGLGMPGAIMGQERAKIAISFLPPPLETATYSLGIYEAKTHKLVRHLYEFAPASVFTTGLNGFITSWDGKDDSGKAVPSGRYDARGYAVGELKVEGKAILGNEWAGDDESLRIKHIAAIAMLPEDLGLVIVADGANGHSQVACFNGADSALRWYKDVPTNASPAPVANPVFLAVVSDTLIVNDGKVMTGLRLSDGSRVGFDLSFQPPSTQQSAGKDGTVWKIEEGVLGQYSAQGDRLRSLAPKDDEPVPVAVAASKTADRLYLLEESKDVQRVRGLSWKETTKEGDKAVSTWTTFFENSIHSAFMPAGPDNTPLTAQTEITLVENPLAPGKPERLKLSATFDAKGSYLTADGLRLRQISQRPNLRAVKLAKNKAANALTLYQYDGAAWDEFSIEGAHEMMSFDAGEIELTATGEKPSEKATEPDL